MPEPITTTIAGILGKVALDAGVELGKKYGPKALAAGKEMLKAVVDYFRGEEGKEYVAQALEKNPEAAAPLVESELKQAAVSDPDFMEQLKALHAKYDAAVKAHAAASGPSYKATLEGDGAIAQGDGATAVGAGGVQVGGNVGGSVITGSDVHFHTGRSPGSAAPLPSSLAKLRDNLVNYFNNSELKSLCFDLGIVYEDLPGETRTELAQSIVAHCHQRGLVPELVRHCQQLRPRVNWQ